jgi:hypothetical protein
MIPLAVISSAVLMPLVLILLALSDGSVREVSIG